MEEKNARQSASEGAAENRDATIPNPEDRTPIAIRDRAGELAVPVADHIPNPGADDARGEGDDDQSIEDSVLMEFLIELMIANPIGDADAEEHDDAIEGDVKRLIVGDIGRSGPKPAAAGDREAIDERIGEIRGKALRHHQEEKNRKRNVAPKKISEELLLGFVEFDLPIVDSEGAPKKGGG